MSAVGLATGPATEDVLVRNLGCLWAAPLPPTAALPVSLKKRGTGSILLLQSASLLARAYCTHSLCGGSALSTLPWHVAFCCITQMWMSVLWKGLALMDGVSTWMAPSAVPATGAMK